MNTLKKNLSESEKNIAAFSLSLSDDAFDVWIGEKKITPEIYDEICQTAARFLDPELIIRICERFPEMCDSDVPECPFRIVNSQTI